MIFSSFSFDTSVSHSLSFGKRILFVQAQCLPQRESGDRDEIYLRLRFLRQGDYS